jgi:hypothetical protein
MVGILRHQHMSRYSLRGNAIHDETGWSRHLGRHHFLAGVTSILWLTVGDHPELSRHHVETFGDVFAH